MYRYRLWHLLVLTAVAPVLAWWAYPWVTALFRPAVKLPRAILQAPPVLQPIRRQTFLTAEQQKECHERLMEFRAELKRLRAHRSAYLVHGITDEAIEEEVALAKEFLEGLEGEAMRLEFLKELEVVLSRDRREPLTSSDAAH